MILECEQIWKVSSGSEKETMSRQVPMASPLFRADGGIKKAQYL